LKAQHKSYGVVTLHRPSNVDERSKLEEIAGALNIVSESIPLILPVHPRTENRLKSFNITMNSKITLTKPLSYTDFLNLWKDAAVIPTDSGGLQEETTALAFPVPP